ncbi:MAG: V-type ATP synthase subunit A [Tissierellales bacterium]|nr:V-type ATP synthase subunit A [Tissierellales bacterium]MBN2827943.1 V-type ATP synthase subunit A [Tissierellales bacterium]
MNEGRIIYINGSVIKGSGMKNFKLREMVLAGENKLIGEVIGIDGEIATLQIYEETEGLKLKEVIIGLGAPLSLNLGPGLLGNIFDGIGRPLEMIYHQYGDFISEGIGLLSLDFQKLWKVTITADVGMIINEGSEFGWIQETSLVSHRMLVPPGVNGEIVFKSETEECRLDDILIKIKDDKNQIHEIKMYQKWPVRKKRPIRERLKITEPLITGQRILDVFFPIAKGGTVAIPGGFGTGKTITQHQLAKWSDADIIVYIGCGERGNEMTDVLEEFPGLIDPRSGKPIMERTVLIANTSNMPVAAREASIYTGITIAEYYRDMGYHVALMADSTSRWAEALREISGRLEEMPAEEGYPAYLPSRLSEFYERAGSAMTLGHKEGSITIIGAVSPAGGDFSEPVTENTKRYVNVFLALDKKLAYARHYPSINWLNSYSGYVKMLEGWYEQHAGEEIISLRGEMLQLLQEEASLQDIVQLVGEDVLPDFQRLIIEIARVLKVGFLQQNAFHKEDAFVPLEKQYEMLKIIDYLYKKAGRCIKEGIPISKVRNREIFDEVIKIKYNVPNNNLGMLQDIRKRIEDYYDDLLNKYSG